jgi:hypothetical protein
MKLNGFWTGPSVGERFLWQVLLEEVEATILQKTLHFS